MLDVLVIHDSAAFIVVDSGEDVVAHVVIHVFIGVVVAGELEGAHAASELVFVDDAVFILYTRARDSNAGPSEPQARAVWRPWQESTLSHV